MFLTQGLQGSAQCFAGESGDLLTGMYLQGRIFNAVFCSFLRSVSQGRAGVCERGRFFLKLLD